MIFFGVIMVNISEALHAATQTVAAQPMIETLLFGALPALIAAFSYPIGNQLVWQASHNSKSQNLLDSQLEDQLQNQSSVVTATDATTSIQPLAWMRHIPTIKTSLLNDAFNKVWLMTLGSAPFWLILGVILQPELPSSSQTFNTFLVALLSGVIATSLFLYAREHAHSSKEVASVDATQASEVIFALIGGVLLLGTPLPSIAGIIGIILIILGLVLFARSG